MYQPLAACSGCRRHVRASEVRCPFCGAERTPVTIESVAMVRMSRAATLAAALAIAGCRSEPTPIAHDPAAAKPSPEPTPSPVPKPTATPDAGLVDDPGGQVDIYGAPPPPPSAKPTVPAPPYGIAPPPPPPKP